jgi:hypothetical protein
MPIRLIATDFDNTLLTRDRTPHPRSVDAIRRAIAAGVVVVFASGRIRRSILAYTEPLGLQGPIAACNGADVIAADGEQIAFYPVDPRVMDTVVAYCRANDVHVNVYTRHEVLYLNQSDWGDVYLSRVRSVQPRKATIEEARSLEISKILLLDSPEAVARHRKALVAELDPALARVTESEPEYLEFLRASVSKGEALRNICDRLGISQAETAAIGDFQNDLEMIQWAAVGAAVANASAEVLEAADVVVGSNEEGGVGEFIDSLLANARE